MNEKIDTHPQTLIAESPMTKMQIITIGICILINMVDGFDVLAIAFTAPVISDAWELGPAQLGVVFSAGGFGMMLGAFFLGPLADYRGRRFSVMLGLIIVTVGMLATILVNSIPQLMAARAFTGVGIGALLASLNTLVAEYSSEKYRNACITALHLGYPLGATLGGLMAAVLISQFGWQSVFLIGGLLSLALLVISVFILPESIDFIIVRQGQSALNRLNELMRRMGHSELTELPDPLDTEKAESIGFRRLLSKDLMLCNILLPLAFFMVMFHLYFVLQWTPKLIVELGHSVEQGIQVSTLITFTAAIGMLVFGFLATRFSLAKVETWLSVIAAGAMLLFGLFASSPYPILLVLVAFMGITHSGLFPGLYSIAPRAYPASARAAGISMSIGVARLGAVFAPAFAGFLLAKGVSASTLIMIFAAPLIVPALVVNLIPMAGQSTEGQH